MKKYIEPTPTTVLTITISTQETRLHLTNAAVGILEVNTGSPPSNYNTNVCILSQASQQKIDSRGHFQTLLPE